MEPPLTALPTQIMRLADLATRKPTAFSIAPDAAQRAAIARALNIPKLRKFQCHGQISPIGKTDWQLDAKIGATVVQDCVITLDPVTTRIDEPFTRHYAADFVEPDAAETEMVDDDTTEPLPASLDLYALAMEALSLALPAFPRADGATLETAKVA